MLLLRLETIYLYQGTDSRDKFILTICGTQIIYEYKST